MPLYDTFLHFFQVKETLNTLHRDYQVDDFRKEEWDLYQWSLHQIEDDQGCGRYVEIQRVTSSNEC